ncbi:hypothetical protein [Burkholderia ambifaria]|uniref:hypothetical protein n=1 Tax=Burkholderia ambifaria TaxID=152480 RepID=UPI002FDFAAF5
MAEVVTIEAPDSVKMRIYERVPDCVNEAIPIRLSAAAIRIGAGALLAGSRTHLAHRVSRIYKPGGVRHRPRGAEARAARPSGLPRAGGTQLAHIGPDMATATAVGRRPPPAIAWS